MKNLNSICLLLAICLSFACAVETESSNLDENTISKLKNTNMGQVLMGFAELNSLSQAPMDDLIQAVGQLVTDLEDRASQLDEEFNTRSNFHQSEKTRLTDLIQDSQIDVSNNSEALENTMNPGLQLLNNKVDSLGKNIDENTEYIQKISTERENANQAYNDRVVEQNDALKSIDECLEIIKEVSGGNISLAENADSIQESIQKVVDQIKEKGTDNDLVQVLAELAMQKFADMSALLAVSNALTDVKTSVLNDLQQEHDDENRSQTDFLGEKKEKESEIREFQKNLILLQSDIKGLQDKIAETENFIDIRNGDLKNFSSQLDREDASFEAATSAYNGILEQLQREEAIANDTLKLIKNAGFADFLNNRAL